MEVKRKSPWGINKPPIWGLPADGESRDSVTFPRSKQQKRHMQKTKKISSELREDTCLKAVALPPVWHPCLPTSRHLHGFPAWLHDAMGQPWSFVGLEPFSLGPQLQKPQHDPIRTVLHPNPLATLKGSSTAARSRRCDGAAQLQPLRLSRAQNHPDHFSLSSSPLTKRACVGN